MAAATKHHHDGNGTLCIGGRDQRHLDVDSDSGIGGVIHVTDKLLANGGICGQPSR